MDSNTEEVDKSESSSDEPAAHCTQDECEHKDTVLVSCRTEDDHCPDCINHHLQRLIAIPEGCSDELATNFFLQWSKNLFSHPAYQTEFVNLPVYDGVSGMFRQKVYVITFQCAQDGLETAKICECHKFDDATQLFGSGNNTRCQYAYLDESLEQVCLAEWFCPSCQGQCDNNHSQSTFSDENHAAENIKAKEVGSDTLGHPAASLQIMNENIHEDFRIIFATEVGKTHSLEPATDTTFFHLANDVAFDTGSAWNTEEAPTFLIAQKHRQLSSAAVQFTSPLPSLLSAGSLNDSMERLVWWPVPDPRSLAPDGAGILLTTRSRLHSPQSESLFVSKFKLHEVLASNEKKSIFNNMTVASRSRVKGQLEPEPSDTNESTGKSSSASNGKDSAKKKVATGSTSSTRSDNHVVHTEGNQGESSGDTSGSGNSGFHRQLDTDKSHGSIPKLGASLMLSSKKLGRKIQIKRIVNLPCHQSGSPGKEQKSEVYDPFNPTEEETSDALGDVGKRETKNIYDPFEPTLSDEEREKSDSATLLASDFVAVHANKKVDNIFGVHRSSKQVSKRYSAPQQVEQKGNSTHNLLPVEPIDMFSPSGQQVPGDENLDLAAENLQADMPVENIDLDVKHSGNELVGKEELQDANMAPWQMEAEDAAFIEEELDKKLESDKEREEKRKVKDGNKECSFTRKRKKKIGKSDCSASPIQSESEEGGKGHCQKHKSKPGRKERSPKRKSAHESRECSPAEPESVKHEGRSKHSPMPQKHGSKRRNRERSRTPSKHINRERSQTPQKGVSREHSQTPQKHKTKRNSRERSSTPLKRRTKRSPKRRGKHSSREHSRTPSKNKIEEDSRERSPTLPKRKSKYHAGDRSSTPPKQRSKHKTSEQSPAKSRRKNKHSNKERSPSPPKRRSKRDSRGRSPAPSKRKSKHGGRRHSPTPPKSINRHESREPSDSHRMQKRKRKHKSEYYSPEITEKNRSPGSCHKYKDLDGLSRSRSRNESFSPNRDGTPPCKISLEQNYAVEFFGSPALNQRNTIKEKDRRKHREKSASSLLGYDSHFMYADDDDDVDDGIKKRKRSRRSLEGAEAVSSVEDNVASKTKRHLKNKKHSKDKKRLSSEQGFDEPVEWATLDDILMKTAEEKEERRSRELKQGETFIVFQSGSPDLSSLDTESHTEVKSRKKLKHSKLGRKKSQNESTIERDSDFNIETKDKKRKGKDARKSREERDHRKRNSSLSSDDAGFVKATKSSKKTKHKRRTSDSGDEFRQHDSINVEKIGQKSRSKRNSKSDGNTGVDIKMPLSSPNEYDSLETKILFSLSSQTLSLNDNATSSMRKEPQVANLRNLVSVPLSPRENLNNSELNRRREISKDSLKSATPSSAVSSPPSPGWNDKMIVETQEIKESLSYAEEFLEQSRKRWEERKKMPSVATSLSNVEAASTTSRLTSSISPDIKSDTILAPEKVLDDDEQHDFLDQNGQVISTVHEGNFSSDVDLFSSAPRWEIKSVQSLQELQPIRDNTRLSPSDAECGDSRSSNSLKPSYDEKQDRTKITENSSEVAEPRLLDSVTHGVKTGESATLGSSQGSATWSESQSARPIETVSGISHEKHDSPRLSDEDRIFEHLMPTRPGSTLIEVFMNEAIAAKDPKIGDAVNTPAKKDNASAGHSTTELVKLGSVSTEVKTAVVEAVASKVEPKADFVEGLGEKANVPLSEKAVLNPTQILNSIGLNPKQKSAAQNAILSIAELSKHLQLDKLIKSRLLQSNRELQNASPSIDTIESSAVEMHNKGKKKGLLKKIQFQERVAEEAKHTIKPYYERREINKTEYKEIMKRAVNKICSSESTMELNIVKTRRLIRRYIEKYQQKNAFKRERMKSKLSNEVPRSERPESPQPPKFQPLSPKRDNTEKVDYFKLAVGTPNLLKREPRKVVTLPDLPLPPPPPPPPPKRSHF